jgi:ATP-binding cassette, subfamily B, bacterial
MNQTRFRRLLLGHMLQVKGSLLVASMCTLGLALADVLRPWPLKIIVDSILLNKPLPHLLSSLSPLVHSQKTEAVVLISLSIVLITAVKSACAYSQLHITSQVGYRLAHAFRRELFTHLQRLSISFHKRVQSGELLTKVTTDTNNLRDVFSDFVLTFLSESLTLIGMLAIMLAVNWKLSLIVLATIPPLATLSLYRFRTIRDSARRQRKAEGQIASRISETLSSILVVQAFGREHYEERRFDNQSAQTTHEGIRTARMEAAAARGVDVISAIGTWAVVLVGALQALNGQMTPGGVLVFASYMNSFYGPIRNLVKLSAKFSRASVSARRISDILEIEPDVRDNPDAVEAAGLRGEIVLDRVSFNYAPGIPVLRNVSLSIRPGQHVALLGPSGSGKSTLTGLLLRFYDPLRGMILIDGRNIRDYKRESLRREIGIVLQDSILFGATVRENIAYGKLDATDEEIVAAAKSANAHDFIMALENGYDTVISERGGNLSGGQRQRIAIARTFIRNVPMLILDEPMTGLDVESEAAVRAALRHLMAGRTSLLITHDLLSAAECDQIVMLEGGTIVERGSHEELLSGSARYRELWEMKSNQLEEQRAGLFLGARTIPAVS